MLLGWQPATLINRPSEKNLAAIRHVAAIRPTYGFDPHNVFSVWLPSKAELATIRRGHAFAGRNVVANAFKSSLKNSPYAPSDALELLADREPVTWSKARAALESAIARSNEAPRVAEACVALEKLERAFRDQVLRPLEPTGETGLEALQAIFAADLGAMWYEDLGIVQAARRVIAGQFPGYAAHLNDAALNRKLRMVRALAELTRLKFKK